MSVPPGVVQRYPVPGNLACGNLVEWLKSSSPYAPEWAENRVNYSFAPAQFVDVQYRDTADGQVEGTAKGKKDTAVKMESRTDLPVWKPGRRPNRNAELRAWQTMLTALRAHENEHVRIGTVWRPKIEAKARSVKLTATGSARSAVNSQLVTQLGTQVASWVAEAQAEHDRFDAGSDHGSKPYKDLPAVRLACPTAASSE